MHYSLFWNEWFGRDSPHHLRLRPFQPSQKGTSTEQDIFGEHLGQNNLYQNTIQLKGKYAYLLHLRPCFFIGNIFSFDLHIIRALLKTLIHKFRQETWTLPPMGNWHCHDLASIEVCIVCYQMKLKSCQMGTYKLSSFYLSPVWGYKKFFFFFIIKEWNFKMSSLK